MGSVLPCCQEPQQTRPSENPPPRQPSTLQLPNILKPKLDPVRLDIPVENSNNNRSLLPQTPRSQRPNQRFKNYQSLRVLGQKNNMVVALAQHKQTGCRFAMKILPKTKINQSNLLQTQLISSIRKNPFLINIKEIFEQNSNIYIVMEYLPKGDLYFYTHKQGISLSQDVIRHVLAQIIKALQYLHQQRIVYRALKPQNILITDQGHIKLTDYSFSKVFLESSASKGISTFIGAIQYMAPQVITGRFDKKVDIWALGIVAYELKFKQNPVEQDGKIHHSIPQYSQLLKKNFLNQKINSKIGRMSHNFRELLLRLLDKNPQTRISLKQLQSHQFFQNVNWNEVQQRKNDPPLAEVIRNNDFIRFRDPTTQHAQRKQIIKRHDGSVERAAVNFVQVRSSS